MMPTLNDTIVKRFRLVVMDTDWSAMSEIQQSIEVAIGGPIDLSVVVFVGMAIWMSYAFIKGFCCGPGIHGRRGHCPPGLRNSPLRGNSVLKRINKK